MIASQQESVLRSQMWRHTGHLASSWGGAGPASQTAAAPSRHAGAGGPLGPCPQGTPACRPTLLRLLSASAEAPHALLASKARVLPFSLDRDAADGEFERHHGALGVFATRPAGWESCKATLLPFWCISASSRVTVQSAQVGRRRLVTRYDPATRSNRMEWVTDWQFVALDWQYSRRWAPESPECQVYGGAKYRHDPAIDRMRPGEHARRALPYHEYVSLREGAAAAAGGGGGGGGGTPPDRIIPFRMAPAHALEMARQAIRAAELRNAESQVLKEVGGDEVRVAMDMQLLGGGGGGHPVVTPLFVPVWVFKSRVRDTAMRTYIAGFTAGVSSGPVLPNPERVAVVAAAAAPVAVGALSMLGLLGPFTVPSVAALTFSALLSGAAGYGVASFWPQLYAQLLQLRRLLQRQLPEAGEAERDAWWRQEWVRQDWDDEGHSYSSEGQYSHSYRRQQQQQQGSSSRAEAAGGARGDPKGYYRALGVPPSATTEEVQAAFRAAAMRWHPDRQPDERKKAESTRRFQEVQEAYATLRSPARRREYDRRGA